MITRYTKTFIHLIESNNSSLAKLSFVPIEFSFLNISTTILNPFQNLINKTLLLDDCRKPFKNSCKILFLRFTNLKESHLAETRSIEVEIKINKRHKIYTYINPRTRLIRARSKQTTNPRESRGGNHNIRVLKRGGKTSGVGNVMEERRWKRARPEQVSE